MRLKVVLIAIVVLSSIFVINGQISSEFQFNLIIFISVAPLALIYLRRNLLNGLLIWFFFLLFQNGLHQYRDTNIDVPKFPDMSLERAAFIGIFSIFFVEIFLRKRKISAVTPMEIAMFLFSMYVAISMISGGTIYEAGKGLTIGYFLAGYAIPFSIFFLARNLVNNEQKMRKVFIFLLGIVGLYLGLTGIFEVLSINYLVFPQYIMNPNLGIHFGQARGPFLNAQVNGLTIGLILFTSLFFAGQRNNKWQRRLISISISSMLIALIFTYSRAAWIGIAIASLCIPIFFPKSRKLYFAGLLVIIVASLTMISFSYFKTSEVSKKADDIVILDAGGKLVHRFKSTSSPETRLKILKASWKMFLDKPFFGFGYKTFTRKSINYLLDEDISSFSDVRRRPLSVHNTMMQLLVELGLVGFSLFIFIMLYPLVIVKRLYHMSSADDSLTKKLSVLSLGNIVLYLISMQGMEYDFAMFPNAIYYLNMGLMIGVYQRYRENIYDKPKQSGDDKNIRLVME